MLRPRWQKVFSDLWSNKIRTLLVVTSIGIGLFSVGLITNLYVILIEDMRTGYIAINPANIQMSLSSFDTDLLDRIKRVEGVSEAEGANLFTLNIKTKKGVFEPIQIKAIKDIKDAQLNQPKVVEGSWPPADREIVVDRYQRDDLAAQIGDDVEIELPSGKIRKLRLVGVVFDQSVGSTESGGFFLAPIQGYIHSDTLTWLEQPATLNQVFITAAENPNDLEHLRQLTNAISDEIEKTGVLVGSSNIRASNDHPNSVFVEAISSILFLLGFLIMFLSAFLITNTLAALLTQQIQQIGIMKSVGARRGQIILIYMILIFIFGLTAFVISAPLSSWASYVFLEYLGVEINMELQDFRIIPLAIILQLVIALIVPQIAGFIPIWQGTRVSVADAFSGYSQENPPSQKNWVDRIIGGYKKISRPLLISLRNTFRRKVRLGLTLLTLTLGGAIFIATFNVQGSLNKYMERIGQYFLADINLTLSQNYRADEIEYVVSQVPGIRLVEGWAAGAGEIIMPDGSTGETISLLGPPSNSTLVEPVLLEGRWVIPGDRNAIALNERFIELFPDMKPGDSLRIKIMGKEVDMTVVGFFQLAGRSGGYLGYTTYEYLSDLMGSNKQASAYRILAEEPNMTLREQEALGQQIEDHLRSQGYNISEISAGQLMTKKTSDGINILIGFLLVMAFLTAAVGSIGLTGTMSLNVLERTREIGITRAIGASNRTVMNLVIVEGVLIGMLSWLFGVLLSFPISTVMSNAINLSLFGAPAAFTFTPTGIILWLVLVLLLSVLASVMPARNAARLTIREVLAYE